MVIKEKNLLATDQEFNNSNMLQAPTEMSATMLVQQDKNKKIEDNARI